MRDPRVLILFNQPVLPPDHPDRGSEEDVLYSVKVVRDSLTAVGIPFDEYGILDTQAGLTALLDRLARRDFDLLFNLFEGAADRPVTEVYLTALLEWLRLPYTGCSSFTLGLARNKSVAKRVFATGGVPTPEFVLLTDAAVPPNPVGFPAIVKPADEDASVGIDQGSVVTTDTELVARVKYVIDQYGPPVLVERYIPGRELQVSLIDLAGSGDPVVLPPAEIAYKPSADRAWPVYTYTAKWDENSDEYKNAPVLVGVDVPAAVLAELNAVSKRAYHLLGARDYARVDTRITPDGDVYVLELNPNPAITSLMIDEGLPVVGSTYDKFIVALVRNAAARRESAKGRRRVRA
jgi:D-alanine-D-alanine ligase